MISETTGTPNARRFFGFLGRKLTSRKRLESSSASALTAAGCENGRRRPDGSEQPPPQMAPAERVPAIKANKLSRFIGFIFSIREFSSPKGWIGTTIRVIRVGSVETVRFPLTCVLVVPVGQNVSVASRRKLVEFRGQRRAWQVRCNRTHFVLLFYPDNP